MKRLSDVKRLAIALSKAPRTSRYISKVMNIENVEGRVYDLRQHIRNFFYCNVFDGNKHMNIDSVIQTEIIERKAKDGHVSRFANYLVTNKRLYGRFLKDFLK